MFRTQLNAYMKTTKYCIVIFGSLLLASCSTTNSLTHSTKSLTDFKIDEKICDNVALQKAHTASLVSQPILSVYQTSFSSCMQAMGWNKTEQPQIKTIPFATTNNGDTFHLDVANMKFDLYGSYNIIRQDKNGLMLRGQDEGYLHLLMQSSDTGFLFVDPVINDKAVLFARNKDKHSRSIFFYQRVNNTLIFACTSYLFFNKNHRMIATFSHDMGTIHSDFIDMPVDQFTALTTLQDNWQRQINNLTP